VLVLQLPKKKSNCLGDPQCWIWTRGQEHSKRMMPLEWIQYPVRHHPITIGHLVIEDIAVNIGRNPKTTASGSGKERMARMA
jgi:hypothetical protein